MKRKAVSARHLAGSEAPPDTSGSQQDATIRKQTVCTSSSNACKQDSADESGREVLGNCVYPNGSSVRDGADVYLNGVCGKGLGKAQMRKDNTRSSKEGGSGVGEPVTEEDIPVSDKAGSSRGESQKKSKYGCRVSGSAAGNGGDRKRSRRSVIKKGPEAGDTQDGEFNMM